MDIFSRYSIYHSQNILDEIRKFFAEGGNPNQRDKYLETLLHQTAESHDSSEAVKELVCAGIDVNLVNIMGHTPLHIAVYQGHRNVVNALIEFGVQVNAKDKIGNTALHYGINACNSLNDNWMCLNENCIHRKPDMNIIRRLLQVESVDVNIRNSKGYTSLLGALTDKNIEIVRALLEKGAHVNMGNFRQETPLHIALSLPDPNVDIASDLIGRGAHITCFDHNDQTPLDRVFKRLGDQELPLFALSLIRLLSFKCQTQSEIISSLEGHSKLLNYYMRCCEELNRMRNEIIGGNISMYDFILRRLKEKKFRVPQIEQCKDIVKILIFGSNGMKYDIYLKLILYSMYQYELYKVLDESCQYENMSREDLFNRIDAKYKANFNN